MKSHDWKILPSAILSFHNWNWITQAIKADGVPIVWECRRCGSLLYLGKGELPENNDYTKFVSKDCDEQLIKIIHHGLL